MEGDVFHGSLDFSDIEGTNQEPDSGGHQRRFSLNEDFFRSVELRLDIHKTKRLILKQEDTDGDSRVTIDDQGPKHLVLRDKVRKASKHNVYGNYMISTLLQELSLLEGTHGDEHSIKSNSPDNSKSVNRLENRMGKSSIARISLNQLAENPRTRLMRLIEQYFWRALIRRVDGDGLSLLCLDPKNRCSDHRPRIYVSARDEMAWDYFREVALARPYLNLEVVRLPKEITPDYVLGLNSAPGILALKLVKRGQLIEGLPFVVPGGRFNELYGWDSYFIILGLLEGASQHNNHLQLTQSMVENLAYEIVHYGMILNANRSYYLLRSQPPFFTEMIFRVYNALKHRQHSHDDDFLDRWLDEMIQAAELEYHNVWMKPPRYVEKVGLCCYCSKVRGIPPETESTHFDKILESYMAKHGVKEKSEFIDSYNRGDIVDDELDGYFLHDRSVRESGHDTTYRLDGRAANLCTVDLCSLLYKYETDLGNYYGQGRNQSKASFFKDAAARRKKIADRLLWDKDRGMYYDYDFAVDRKTAYESATAFWPLWAGMASEEQAKQLVETNLEKFEMSGGLVSGTKESLGEISLDHPNRQWDYPYGWAPHQMMAWEGLAKYGYHEIAARLAYRWCYMLTKAFSDFNGVVPEKFDVVRMSHKVDVEYGNVGTEFKLVPREGFGWMNASYLVGQSYLSQFQKRALGALVHPDALFRQIIPNGVGSDGL